MLEIVPSDSLGLVSEWGDVGVLRSGLTELGLSERRKDKIIDRRYRLTRSPVYDEAGPAFIRLVKRDEWLARLIFQRDLVGSQGTSLT